MRPYIKYISKQFSSLIFLLCALAVLNAIIFVASFYKIVQLDYMESSPTEVIETISGEYSIEGITDNAKKILDKTDVWAIYIDLKGNVAWKFNAPAEIPSKYNLNDIAVLSKGYLKDYPVFINTKDDGLILLGYPKDSYVKMQSNYFSISAIRRFPLFIMCLLIFDLVLIILIYWRSKKKFISKINPIIEGIEGIADGKTVSVEPGGQLAEIAESINEASHVIKRQNEARVNWISGVSHDIRTPLSLIMGYSDKIKNQSGADSQTVKYAEIISQNSTKIKELVADLNLFSMLEYNMQPLELAEARVSKMLRTFVANKLNAGVDECFNFTLDIEQDAEQLEINCNERLIERALENLVNNSIRHNPKGCDIEIALRKKDGKAIISVADNGVGISKEDLERMEKPHYMEALDERFDLRHGLGLIIVKQIVEAHGGRVEIAEVDKGYKTILEF